MPLTSFLCIKSLLIIDIAKVRDAVVVKIRWAATWQNQQNGCALSEDSDQPWHPPSLIRVFAVRMKKAWILSYPLSAQWRLVRLGGCTGWSVFAGRTPILLVLSCRGSGTETESNLQSLFVQALHLSSLSKYDFFFFFFFFFNKTGALKKKNKCHQFYAFKGCISSYLTYSSNSKVRFYFYE